MTSTGDPDSKGIITFEKTLKRLCESSQAYFEKTQSPYLKLICSFIVGIAIMMTNLRPSWKESGRQASSELMFIERIHSVINLQITPVILDMDAAVFSFAKGWLSLLFIKTGLRGIKGPRNRAATLIYCNLPLCVRVFDILCLICHRYIPTDKMPLILRSPKSLLHFLLLVRSPLKRMIN